MLPPEALLQVSPAYIRVASLEELAAREQIGYSLDPADLHGPDCSGETFCVLKEKETGKFGEYRTRRLVLEAWDRWERGEREGGRHGDAESMRRRSVELA